MAIDVQSKLIKLATRELIGLIFLGGLTILIVVDRPIADVHGWDRVWHSLWTHIGIAFCVAAVLGVTVDWAIKSDLISNAVNASLGYLLPDELKPELIWIFDQKFLANQSFNVRLEHLPNENTVILHATVNRTIENIAGKTESVDIAGGTEDWYRPNRETTIEKCEYAITRKGDVKPEKTVEIAQKKNAYGVTYGGHKVPLAPGDQIEIFFVFKSPMPDHGMTFLTFRYPIRKPTVTVEADPTLRALITVSHRTKYNHDEPYRGGPFTQSITGVLVPHQPIFVRWHRTDDIQAKEKTLGEVAI